MVDITVADIDQLYSKSIIMYRGRPARVVEVNRNKEVTILGLMSGRKSVVPFNQLDFRPVLGRIGFINHGGFAFYVVRNPARRYSIGLTTQNTHIYSVTRDANQVRDSYNQVTKMSSKGWAQALMNDYPTFRDAINIAKETKGSCAFDKQFAVDAQRNIFFKKQIVGHIPSRMSTIGRIEFQPAFQFLEILVENHYEKTVRTFAAA